jgi:hypothetical protein
MKVSELIEELKKFPQDAEVLVYDYESFHEEWELDEIYMRGNKVEIK